MANDLEKQPAQGDGEQPTSAMTGWTTPQPEKVPKQTYMPATLALGVVALLWGLVTTYIISIVGLVLIIIAMYFWIGDIRHEH
jgi:hypothetical protein